MSIDTYKKTELQYVLLQLNLKWIINLSVKAETIWARDISYHTVGSRKKTTGVHSSPRPLGTRALSGLTLYFQGYSSAWHVVRPQIILVE